MILAVHGIFTAYGFWLPNDPRGSWSDFVGSWELAKFGKATKTDTRQSVAHVKHDQQQRMLAKAAMKYPPVAFNGIQARAVARGFERAIEESGYRLLSCSIMPDHVHIVIQRNDRPALRIIQHLKTRATQRLNEEGLHPSMPTVWAKSAWQVFLDSEDDVARAVRYVENNPLKEGKRRQRWPFVQPS